MQHCPKLISLLLLLSACQPRPLPWTGPELTQPRQHLTVEELVAGTPQPLLDMSFFARPAWADSALAPFSGTLLLQETELTYPKEKAYYPGENIFPRLELDFIARRGELIPRQTGRISTRDQNNSYWDVMVGTGAVWHEAADGEWSRASFPLTLTDRWVGQARNCVATLVYTPDTISAVCLQCSQETADIDDRQLGNISGILPAAFRARSFADSSQLVARHQQAKANRLPVRPLREIDTDHGIADYFEGVKVTNAPTSLGAVLLDSVLYLHPPQTRHGPYPFPGEMRHGLYSVTKSMAGALALLYVAERYEEDVFDALITDYVPALADHPGWLGVTFAHTLNMVTGTVGSERLEHLYSTLIVAETAEEAIQNIATLGDTPPAPGEQFNYASTNLFVLSYALQRYVEAREDEPVNYWDLVRENVLVPIGAPNFTVLRTMEADTVSAIPILAYGALPTIDEAAKIALLFANDGRHAGQQLLNKDRVREAFGKTEWAGYSTHDDFRGAAYRHSFWSKPIRTGACTVTATYMLGFGENYVVFLPSGAIIFRFYDEHDLDIDELIREVEKIQSSCSAHE